MRREGKREEEKRIYPEGQKRSDEKRREGERGEKINIETVRSQVK